MSTFAIYAFVVTGLYILYMAVVILLDLFGRKDQKKEGAEVIINRDMSGVADDEDVGTYVDEVPDGYSTRSVADVSSDDAPVDFSGDEDVGREEQPVDVALDDEEVLHQEMEASLSAYASLKAVQEQADPAVPSFQGECPSEDFAVVLSQPMSHKSRILRHFVNV